MNTVLSAPAVLRPTWFWIISILALLWNLMGVAAFVMQMNISPDALAALPADQQALYTSMPGWVTIAYAVAVLGGALGCLMLVLKKKLAVPLLVLSLLGVIGQMAYMFLLSDTFKIMGRTAMVMPIVIIVISVFLVWFARMSVRRGWLA